MDQTNFLLFACFVIVVYSRHAKSSFDKVVRSLECHKKVFGSLNVKYAFRVPQTLPWPEDCHGIQLGAIVSRMRNRGDFMKNEKQLSKLEEIGFLKELKQSRMDRSFSITLEALFFFQEEHGHLRVPAKFVFPKGGNDNTPHHLQGLKLGQRVDHIRNGGAYKNQPEKIRRLKELGFEWDAQRQRIDGETVLEALEEYKILYGDLNVPPQFTIPTVEEEEEEENDDDKDEEKCFPKMRNKRVWPKHLWGLRLGQRVCHIRSRGSFPSIHDKLSLMGFQWFRSPSTCEHDADEMQALMEALATYQLTGEYPDLSF